MTVSGLSSAKPLPAGWRWVKLVDVCEFLDYRRKPISEAERAKRNEGKRIEELYPYFGANGQAGWIDDYLFDETLILLAEDGGAFGSADTPIAYKIEGKTWVNNHAHVLRPRDGVDLDFCLASISIRPDLAQLATGNTRPKLNQAVASAIPVPLPPIAEQRRIAGVLREQMATVEKARAAAQARLAAVKDLPDAFLRQVFPQPGQPLPDGWRWVKLGQVCMFRRGPFGGALKKEVFTEDGYKVYEQQHAIQNNFESGSYYISRSKFNEMTAFAIGPGDLIISCSGTMGRVAVVPVGIKPGIINQALLKLTPDINQSDPNYLKYYLQSDQVQARYFRKTAGAAIQNVASVSQLKEIPIPLPPLAEQRRIAGELREQMATAEKACAAADEELSTINALPAAMLRRAFSGDL